MAAAEVGGRGRRLGWASGRVGAGGVGVNVGGLTVGVGDVEAGGVNLRRPWRRPGRRVGLGDSRRHFPDRERVPQVRQRAIEDPVALADPRSIHHLDDDLGVAGISRDVGNAEDPIDVGLQEDLAQGGVARSRVRRRYRHFEGMCGEDPQGLALSDFHCLMERRGSARSRHGQRHRIFARAREGMDGVRRRGRASVAEVPAPGRRIADRPRRELDRRLRRGVDRGHRECRRRRRHVLLRRGVFATDGQKKQSHDAHEERDKRLRLPLGDSVRNHVAKYPRAGRWIPPLRIRKSRA